MEGFDTFPKITTKVFDEYHFLPFHPVPLGPYHMQLRLSDAAKLPKESYLNIWKEYWIEARGLGDWVACITPGRGLEALLDLARERELEREERKQKLDARADRRLYELFFAMDQFWDQELDDEEHMRTADELRSIYDQATKDRYMDVLKEHGDEDMHLVVKRWLANHQLAKEQFAKELVAKAQLAQQRLAKKERKEKRRTEKQLAKKVLEESNPPGGKLVKKPLAMRELAQELFAKKVNIAEKLAQELFAQKLVAAEKLTRNRLANRARGLEIFARVELAKEEEAETLQPPGDTLTYEAIKEDEDMRRGTQIKDQLAWKRLMLQHQNSKIGKRRNAIKRATEELANEERAFGQCMEDLIEQTMALLSEK